MNSAKGEIFVKKNGEFMDVQINCFYCTNTINAKKIVNLDSIALIKQFDWIYDKEKAVFVCNECKLEEGLK